MAYLMLVPFLAFGMLAMREYFTAHSIVVDFWERLREVDHSKWMEFGSPTGMKTGDARQYRARSRFLLKDFAVCEDSKLIDMGREYRRGLIRGYAYLGGNLVSLVLFELMYA